MVCGSSLAKDGSKELGEHDGLLGHLGEHEAEQLGLDLGGSEGAGEGERGGEGGGGCGGGRGAGEGAGESRGVAAADPAAELGQGREPQGALMRTSYESLRPLLCRLSVGFLVCFSFGMPLAPAPAPPSM